MDTTKQAAKVGRYAKFNGYLLCYVGVFYVGMDLWNVIGIESTPPTARQWPSFPYWMTNEFEIGINEDGEFEMNMKGACFRDTVAIRLIADALWTIALLLVFAKLRTEGRRGSLTLAKILFWVEVIIFAFWKLFPLMGEFRSYRYTVCYLTATFLVIVTYVCYTLNALKASFALQEQPRHGMTAILTFFTETAQPNQPERSIPADERPVMADPMHVVVVDEKGKAFPTFG